MDSIGSDNGGPHYGKTVGVLREDVQIAYADRVGLAKEKMWEVRGAGEDDCVRTLLGDAYTLLHSVDGAPFHEPYLTPEQVLERRCLRIQLAELRSPRVDA